MINLPKKIVSITCDDLFVSANRRKCKYILNKGTFEETSICTPAPGHSAITEILRRETSWDVIDELGDYENGFKVVRTANFEYAYVREQDNKLLPFRYDIATNFNKYGYAMIGKAANVSWIDKEFRYLNHQGEMTKEHLNYIYNDLCGFDEVNAFSEGPNPLSKVGLNGCVRYFASDGKIKKFYMYDGEKISEKDSMNSFLGCSTDFNNKGYAIANSGAFVLLSNGYYLPTILARIREEKGFLETLSSKIAKQEQAYTKFLRDIEEKTMDFADDLSKYNNLIAEFGIGSIELKKEELISRYGKDVYLRALTNSSFTFLFNNQEFASEIIDLDLLKSSLAKRGIPSYIDKEDNLFYYNATKYVKKKK